jgi:hypothetical protein
MSRPMRNVLGRAATLLLPIGMLVAGCGGTAETRPADWAYISAAIVQPSCATANCHSTLAKRSGVVLDKTPDGYFQLVCRGFVRPTRPSSSSLIALLKGQGVRRMPPDFALPDEDINLISQWITTGAEYSGPSPAVMCPPQP